MAEHNDSTEKYGKPQFIAVPNVAGYPNKVANTQTQKTRGTGAAVRGNKHSKKMG